MYCDMVTEGEDGRLGEGQGREMYCDMVTDGEDGR